MDVLPGLVEPVSVFLSQTFANGKQFTDEQQKGLARIREHMIANLSIDKENFEVVPIFSRFGGWAPANRTFNNNLENIIRDLNEAIAA